MIEFTPTPEHAEMREFYRKFAEERVKPLAREMDEEKNTPWSCSRRSGMRIFGDPLPESCGGAEASALLCHVRGGDGQGDARTVSPSPSYSLCPPSSGVGTEEQKEKSSVPWQTAARSAASAYRAGAGSDVAAGAPRGKDGDAYTSTAPRFLPPLGFADIFLDFALTDKDAGARLSASSWSGILPASR